MRCPKSISTALAVVVAVMVVVAAGRTIVRAHELGSTRVSATFDDRRGYDIAITTDALALVEKLGAAAGWTVPPDADATRLASLLANAEEAFRQRVAIRFDMVDMRPSIAYTVVPGADEWTPAVATIRLTGQAPGDADRFTWAYGWTFTAYALTVRSSAGERAPEWLEPDQVSTPFDVTSATSHVGWRETVARYFSLGFTHIVPYGLDHVLFVLGLYLLSRRARDVLWQVSAFTVAHSMTLGLSMYGIVAVAPQVVEPLIALSIAYVAIENVFRSRLNTGRIVLVFAFGLLHGLGFAGVLDELGVPGSAFVPALAAFNVGVEVGQLAVIGAAFVLVGWRCSRQVWYHSRVVVPLSVLIACTAVYWTIARLSF